MTCDNCIHYDVCEALEMNGIAKVHPIQCGYFNDKSRYIELPCKVGDRVYVDGDTWEKFGFMFGTMSKNHKQLFKSSTVWQNMQEDMMHLQKN